MDDAENSRFDISTFSCFYSAYFKANIQDRLIGKKIDFA
jgi:hypothetical protein